MWGSVWVRRRGLQALSYALEGPCVPGIRVLVPLGKYNTPSIGLLVAVHPPEKPPPTALKSILQPLDQKPLYDEVALEFFSWLVEYYMASPGDVAYLALPGRVGGISDWIGHWREGPPQPLRPKKIYAAVQTEEGFSVRKVARRLGLQPRKFLTLLRKWERAGYLHLEAVVRRSVRRPPSLLEIPSAYRDETAFRAAWEKLPADQQRVWLRVLEKSLRGEPMVYSHWLRVEGAPLRRLLQAQLLERVPARRYYEKLYARPLQPYTLTPAQAQAVQAIQTYLEQEPLRPVLLHGVTASGKTFLYMEIMRTYLQRGKQVLYLLPEIALTKQTLDRLRATFGEAMALYHSGLSEAERFRVWKAVREDAVDVIVGTRSALFLPFHRLGLLILDEEHDPSFGQEGRPPLYQARDSAVFYSTLRKIPILLGSATPSLESFANVLREKYHYVSLKQKALPSLPPTLHVVDMRVELRERLSTGVFSSTLRELLEACFGRGEQAILFRNRRGYAPMLLCQTCGHRWECPHCAITLTYHKGSQALICHYCGHKIIAPSRCPVCGGEQLSLSGIGTERIEEQLVQFFPGVRALRMDRDTTGGHKHEALIAAFERGEADVLIGTQMVTKGLDFPRVTVVGVLYADSLWSQADFRAEERAYQLLVQLMGRAGRQGLQSHIVVQTFRPEMPLLSLLDEPYEEFARPLLAHRERYTYPPFRRLILVNLYHKETTPLETQATLWAESIQKYRWGEVLGPVYAEIPRIRGWYHMQVLLKLPLSYAYGQVRKTLRQLRESHYQRWGKNSARVSFHVDP